MRIPKLVKKRYPKIHNKLDTVVSKIVRQRDKYCITCGTTEGLTCSHFIPRGKFGTRWDLFNCNCQCSICNLNHDHDKGPYTAYMLATYGQGVIDELRRVCSGFVSTFDQHMILSELKEYAAREGYKI